MRICILKNRNRAREVANIHMKSFQGFFLTFLGEGFLRQLYRGFIEYEDAGLIAAVSRENRIVGFLAYSDDISGFYRYLIKKHLFSFAWYAGIGFVKNPRIFLRLVCALTYSREAVREENYIELSSIGILPCWEGRGIGSKLIAVLKQKSDSSKYAYIKLETDAVNNERANQFYQKNGFVLHHAYQTREGRKMNEYRYYL